eukprot:COSAG05_NODE_18872_length_301_cov_0.821782_1_plen_43_part_10
MKVVARYMCCVNEPVESSQKIHLFALHIARHFTISISTASAMA